MSYAAEIRSPFFRVIRHFFLKDFAITSDARPVAAAQRVVVRTLVAVPKNRVDNCETCQCYKREGDHYYVPSSPMVTGQWQHTHFGTPSL
jgi:hypothetical protein